MFLLSAVKRTVALLEAFSQARKPLIAPEPPSDTEAASCLSAFREHVKCARECASGSPAEDAGMDITLPAENMEDMKFHACLDALLFADGDQPEATGAARGGELLGSAGCEDLAQQREEDTGGDGDGMCLEEYLDDVEMEAWEAGEHADLVASGDAGDNATAGERTAAGAAAAAATTAAAVAAATSVQDRTWGAWQGPVPQAAAAAAQAMSWDLQHVDDMEMDELDPEHNPEGPAAEQLLVGPLFPWEGLPYQEQQLQQQQGDESAAAAGLAAADMDIGSSEQLKKEASMDGQHQPQEQQQQHELQAWESQHSGLPSAANVLGSAAAEQISSGGAVSAAAKAGVNAAACAAAPVGSAQSFRSRSNSPVSSSRISRHYSFRRSTADSDADSVYSSDYAARRRYRDISYERASSRSPRGKEEARGRGRRDSREWERLRVGEVVGSDAAGSYHDRSEWDEGYRGERGGEALQHMPRRRHSSSEYSSRRSDEMERKDYSSGRRDEDERRGYSSGRRRSDEVVGWRHHSRSRTGTEGNEEEDGIKISRHGPGSLAGNAESGARRQGSSSMGPLHTAADADAAAPCSWQTKGGGVPAPQISSAAPAPSPERAEAGKRTWHISY